MSLGIVETMDAAVYHGREDIRIERRAIPEVAQGELLVKVGVAGVCGTDVGEWDHGPMQIPLNSAHPSSGHLGPMITGHEFSGTVVAVGSGVGEEWLGKQVASCGSVACGICAACLSGASNRCKKYVGVGLHRDGALAGFVLTPPESCVVIDGLGISLDEAALCQPMAIAVHCVARAGDVKGQDVVVLGAGGIGAFLIAALVAEGAQVTALDLSADRLAIAKEMGATHAVLASGTPTDIQAVLNALGGNHPPVIFEVSGSASGLETAFALAATGTRIVAVGIQRAPVNIDLATLTVREITLIGTNAQVRETDFPKAVRLIAARPGGWQRIAPTVLPLSDLVSGALRPIRDGHAPALKVLIDPWASTPRPSRPQTAIPHPEASAADNSTPEESEVTAAP